MTQTCFRLLPTTMFVMLMVVAGCTHIYQVKVQGKAAPGSEVQLSRWAQPKDHAPPLQQAGQSGKADDQGNFELESKTVLDFAGPPPFLTLELTGLDPRPVCVVLPTEGLWPDEESKTLLLPALRPLVPEEVGYDLAAPPLAKPLKVLRRDPTRDRCLMPGG
jgi:hypothetical protein